SRRIAAGAFPRFSRASPMRRRTSRDRVLGRMKVLALVPHPPAGASTRYRVLQFVPALEQRGWTVEVAPMLDAAAFDRLYRRGAYAAKAWDFARAGARRLVQAVAAAGADVVLVHREMWPLAGMVHEEL